MGLTRRGKAQAGRQDGGWVKFTLRGYLWEEGGGELLVRGQFGWKLSFSLIIICVCLFVNRRFSTVPVHLKYFHKYHQLSWALQSLLGAQERTHWLLDRPTTVTAAGSRQVTCSPSPCLSCASVSRNQTESFAAQGCEDASPTLQSFGGQPYCMRCS